MAVGNILRALCALWLIGSFEESAATGSLRDHLGKKFNDVGNRKIYPWCSKDYHLQDGGTVGQAAEGTNNAYNAFKEGVTPGNIQLENARKISPAQLNWLGMLCICDNFSKGMYATTESELSQQLTKMLQRLKIKRDKNEINQTVSDVTKYKEAFGLQEFYRQERTDGEEKISANAQFINTSAAPTWNAPDLNRATLNKNDLTGLVNTGNHCFVHAAAQFCLRDRYVKQAIEYLVNNKDYKIAVITNEKRAAYSKAKIEKNISEAKEILSTVDVEFKQKTQQSIQKDMPQTLRDLHTLCVSDVYILLVMNDIVEIFKQKPSNAQLTNVQVQLMRNRVPSLLASNAGEQGDAAGVVRLIYESLMKALRFMQITYFVRGEFQLMLDVPNPEDFGIRTIKKKARIPELTALYKEIGDAIEKANLKTDTIYEWLGRIMPKLSTSTNMTIGDEGQFQMLEIHVGTESSNIDQIIKKQLHRISYDSSCRNRYPMLTAQGCELNTDGMTPIEQKINYIKEIITQDVGIYIAERLPEWAKDKTKEWRAIADEAVNELINHLWVIYKSSRTGAQIALAEQQVDIARAKMMQEEISTFNNSAQSQRKDTSNGESWDSKITQWCSHQSSPHIPWNHEFDKIIEESAKQRLASLNEFFTSKAVNSHPLVYVNQLELEKGLKDHLERIRTGKTRYTLNQLFQEIGKANWPTQMAGCHPNPSDVAITWETQTAITSTPDRLIINLGRNGPYNAKLQTSVYGLTAQINLDPKQILYDMEQEAEYKKHREEWTARINGMQGSSYTQRNQAIVNLYKQEQISVHEAIAMAKAEQKNQSMGESKQNAVYMPTSILLRAGETLDKGHYTAIIREALRSDKWYKINDNDVIEITSKQVNEEAMGGYLSEKSLQDNKEFDWNLSNDDLRSQFSATAILYEKVAIDSLVTK
ncbi:MAG: hypothetical protein LBF56_01270 [Holosporales bacterium]|jgi:hypothetical protein|nr:hypothetical protein [Holosporales bacterium]